MTKQPSIEDLEQAMLTGDEIEIRPDGRVRRKRIKRPKRPLTFRENLGSEYAI